MSGLRILVADDHETVRRGVRSLVEGHAGWVVAGEAVDGREAVEKAEELQPDVVILDVTMPVLNGLEAASRIRKAVPGAEILILTMHDSEELMQEVLATGARGYILKSDAGSDLVAAVDAVRRHKPYFTSKLANLVLEGYLEGRSPTTEGPAVRNPLTAREREIIQLLAEGRSNKEIAVSLNLSLKTVQTHRNNIMRKLDLHSLSELVRYAVRNRIIEP